MSVTLIKGDLIVPVATERVFTEFWQPLCLKLSLQWVPNFQSGINIDSQDITNVIEELSILKTYTLNEDWDKRTLPLERIENLIEVLEELMKRGESVYIG